MLRRSTAWLVLVCLTACTTLPPMPPLPAGHELAVTLPERRPAREPGVDVSIPADQNLADAAGTAGGGAVGASAGLAASAACGLLIVICAPVFMFVGGTAGSMGVAAMADAARPPSDESTLDRLKRLEQRVLAHAKANPMDEQLRLVVVDKAGAHWRVVAASKRNSMTVQVTGFALRAEADERISLEVRATMAMTREDIDHTVAMAPRQPGDAARPVSAPVVFSSTFWFESTAADLAQWLDESGEFMNREFARAYEAIAQKMVAALGAQRSG